MAWGPAEGRGRRRRSKWWRESHIFGVALALALGGGGHARAEHATCDVPIIQALHNGDDGQSPTIDPAIRRLKPYLQRAPFTAWREFKLVDRKELRLPLHGSARFALPNGRTAQLTFAAHTTGPGDHRLRLHLAIEDGAKKMLDTTFVLDEGGVVLHAGQRYQDGILVLGVSCRSQE
jgi:hypothetical protein